MFYVLGSDLVRVLNFCFRNNLVTRDVIVQPPSYGGFSVVNVQLKVWALLLQWVRRFSLTRLHESLFSLYGVIKAFVLLLFRFCPIHFGFLEQVSCLVFS